VTEALDPRVLSIKRELRRLSRELQADILRELQHMLAEPPPPPNTCFACRGTGRDLYVPGQPCDICAEPPFDPVI
jgi:hypothetical protein